MDRTDVYDRIDSERDYQEFKWPGHSHEVGAYITILDFYVQEAKTKWTKNCGDQEALVSIRKIAAIAVACAEEHGISYRESDQLYPTGGL